MTTIINTIRNDVLAINNTISTAMGGFRSTAEVTKFAENNVAYKVMLLVSDDGDFVPVVTFCNPFEGKRLHHAVVDYCGTLMSCINQENEWVPTHGVGILWSMPDGTARYTCAPLTAWERFHNLHFLTSFSWMKGWTAREAFEAISFFSTLGTDDSATGGWDYSTIEKWSIHVDDDSILGIVHSTWFRNAYRDAMGMKKPATSAYEQFLLRADK